MRRHGEKVGISSAVQLFGQPMGGHERAGALKNDAKTKQQQKAAQPNTGDGDGAKCETSRLQSKKGARFL